MKKYTVYWTSFNDSMQEPFTNGEYNMEFGSLEAAVAFAELELQTNKGIMPASEFVRLAEKNTQNGISEEEYNRLAANIEIMSVEPLEDGDEYVEIEWQSDTYAVRDYDPETYDFFIKR